jgi:hypothetical protein
MTGPLGKKPAPVMLSSAHILETLDSATKPLFP